MAEGEHIDVGIAVTGASAAAGEAKKVEDALQDMNRAAAPQDGGNPMAMPPAMMGPAPEAAERTRDLADATRESAEATAHAAKETALLTDEQKRTAEEAGKAAKEFTDEAVKQLEAAKAAKEHEKALRETALATRMMVAMQAAEQFKPYLTELAKAIEQSRTFGEASDDVARGLDATGEALGILTTGLSTFIATGNAAAAVAASTASGFAGVIAAWKEMRAAQANTDLSASRAAESQNRLVEYRQRWNSLAGDRAAIETMDEELAILREQEHSLNRQLEARQRLADAQNEAASLEVRMARATGGDVAAAQASSLATQLATGLQKLEGDLAKAKTRMEIANRQYEQMDQEVSLMEDMKDTESGEYSRLVAAKAKALEDRERAAEALDDQTEAFALSRQNLIRSVEVNLAETEKEYGDATSAAAKKGFDAVYQQLVSAQAGQADAVSKISADMGAVTAAVDAKAAEVKAAQDAHAAATVQSIGTLAPQPAQADAVAGAVREVGAKLEASGTATISALQQVANIAADQDRRIKVIDEKLKVLSARIR